MKLKPKDLEIILPKLFGCEVANVYLREGGAGYNIGLQYKLDQIIPYSESHVIGEIEQIAVELAKRLPDQHKEENEKLCSDIRVKEAQLIEKDKLIKELQNKNDDLLRYKNAYELNRK